MTNIILFSITDFLSTPARRGGIFAQRLPAKASFTIHVFTSKLLYF
jgi:hypothetical protein